MLTSFTIERRFNLLTVRIYVDCSKREADMTITYDRRLVRSGLGAGYPMRRYFEDVRTPELAEAWLGAEVADCREAGAVISRLEAFEFDCRRQPLSLMGEPA